MLNFENSLAIHFRRSIKGRYSRESIFARLRKGERDARQIITDDFDHLKLKNTLGYLRNLTNESPDIFQPEIVKTCANAGVAVAFIPELPNTFINGAAFGLNNRKQPYYYP
ncbi:hypothetical protein JXJ21_21445 [candidate division KSB1 bacterium]|nr:hypothetical protein [candidate division KSB1 bacterium]